MLTDDHGSLGGSSSPVSQAQNSFDVAKESDVIALLKLIHLNPFEPEVKNILRDYIFSYRQDLSETNHAVLKAYSETLGITILPYVPKSKYLPSVSTQSALKSGPLRIRSERPVPAFKVRPVPIEKEVASAQGVTKVPVTVIAATPEVKITPTPAPTLATETIQTTTNAPVTQIPSAQSTVGAQDRIAYIKKSINDTVGNPVHLIETQGALGREYMNALLDAMKKANGAPEGELAQAMEKLEYAYAQVFAALKKGGAESPIPESMPSASSVESVAAVLPVTPTSMAPSGVPTDSDTSAQDRVRMIEERLQALKKRVATEYPQRVATPSPVPTVTAPEIQMQEVPQTTLPTVSSRDTSETQSEVKLQSVAKNKQLEDLMRSRKEEHVAQVKQIEMVEESKKDPLYTSDVSAGLEQLLSEWTLFRSSGFFGTGPSGKDHSLYQKIAQLNMASVVAGRFEGATPLIKQSIADYMNGWRYEEGIVHEHGETFEHYLRKVVQHIITKKKASLGLV